MDSNDVALIAHLRGRAERAEARCAALGVDPSVPMERPSVLAEAMRRLGEAERERDEARGRARTAAQTIVEAIGADGPANVEELAPRIVAALAAAEAEVVALRTRALAAEAVLDSIDESHPSTNTLDIGKLCCDLADTRAALAAEREAHAKTRAERDERQKLHTQLAEMMAAHDYAGGED